jgi:crossover junction endodeoxyribonuclease RusA
MSYILNIPVTPPSLNMWNRLHWAKRRALKREWESIVWAVCKSQKIPLLDRPKVEAVIYFPDKYRRDLDNYTALMWKFTLDGLVLAGVLADDDPEHVELGTVRFDLGPPRTVVMLVPTTNSPGKRQSGRAKTAS